MQTLPDDGPDLEGHSLHAAKSMVLEPTEIDVMQHYAPSNQMQISPNPSSSDIHIMLPEVYREGTLRILSLTGNEIHSQSLRGQQSISFDLSSVAAGIYLITVQSPNGHYQKKFVKL